MRRISLVVLLAVLVLATAAWSQQTQVTTIRFYEPDVNSVQFFMQHDLVVYSSSSHGEQTDIVRRGNFLRECYISGAKIHMRSCGNVVYKIAAEVQVTINVQCQQGKQGPPGINGRDGVDGANGRDGRDGRDGHDGRDGCDGRDGRNGRDGLNGYILVQQMPRYGQCGPPFGGCGSSYQSPTFVEPARNGWVDAVPQIFGGWLANSAIRPSRTDISLNNSSGSSSSAHGGSSYASASQQQGQNQGQQQGQEQGQQQGQESNNTNNNSNSNNNNNNNQNTNNQTTDVDVSNDIGIVNDNAAAASAN